MMEEAEEAKAGSSDWMDRICFEGSEMRFPARGQSAGNPQCAPSVDPADGDVALVSLGCFCGVKLSFRKLGLSSATLPFDWMRTRIEKVIEFVKTDFSNFYDGLDEHIEVPGTNLLAFRGSGHSFWHDDIRDSSDRSKLQRRIDRFLDIGSSSRTLLFVRALCTTAELAHADELHAELLQKYHAGGENEVFLLAIVCMQEKVQGPVVCSSFPGLLVYCLSPSAHDHEKYGGEPAPFCEPVSWALEFIRAGGVAKAQVVPSAASLLASGTLNDNAMGLDGMNGVASFSENSEKPVVQSFAIGSRVEAEYLGEWYLATVMGTPQAAKGNVWEVHCDVDLPGTSTTTFHVRAAPPGAAPARIPERLPACEAGQSDWMDAISFDKDGTMSCPPLDGPLPARDPGHPAIAGDSEFAEGGVALVSLGCFCGVKLSFRKLGIGAATLPFDWMRTRIEKIIEFLQTDFSTLYDDLNGPIPVPDSNLLCFRGCGHSFWHDDIRQAETRTKLRRRTDRLMGIGEASSSALFVRALATTDELSRVDELYKLLLRRFGGGDCQVYLLAIVAMQDRTQGPIVVHGSSPGLLLYCLTGQVHNKIGGEPAPFVEPIKWALEHIAGRSAETCRTVDSAAAVLEDGLVDATVFGLDGMNGVASFEPPPGEGDRFLVGSRVEAEYGGQWYLATVLAPPEAAWDNLWLVHCDADPEGVKLTTPHVRALSS